MPYWMSRIAPQAKLFHTTQIAGMSYSTAVHSTCGTIVKPPSPQIETHGRSGAASLAPRIAARAEAHAREAPGVEHRLRPARLPELHEPVVVDAGVERDDRIVRQHRAAVGDDALRADRRSRAARSSDATKASHSLRHSAICACQARLARRALRAPRSQLGQQLPQERARVGEDAEVRRDSCGRSRRGRRRRGRAS